MPVLKLWQNGICRNIPFEGTPALDLLLREAGVTAEHPCGGLGICKKCVVTAQGHISPPSEAEIQAGCRLSCQITLLGDAQIWLADTAAGQIQLSGSTPALRQAMPGRYGAAVDVGTTTIALKIYDLKNGHLLAEEGAMNPQRSIAADVMGRIGAATGGLLPALQDMVADTIRAMLCRGCDRICLTLKDIDRMVITGNTAMLYLLTGRDPSCLAAAPFLADCLFGCPDTLLGIPVYYPPCMNAFVGGDLTCAILDSGMDQQPQTVLLCDIGTNGELALYRDGKLYVTSTAAGPAFEGAGISCGCGSIPGAIDRVWIENGTLQIHTIGEKQAVGLCGSGLVDAVAALLETQDIDETGAMAADSVSLAEGVVLLPADIRAVQLAKGAIAAGIRTLLEQAAITPADIDVFYIAGGFGSHLNTASAVAIGLLPDCQPDNVRILGNAALSGAARLLLNQEDTCRAGQLAAQAIHVNLGGSPRFNQYFIESMLFGNEDFFEEFRETGISL